MHPSSAEHFQTSLVPPQPLSVALRRAAPPLPPPSVPVSASVLYPRDLLQGSLAVGKQKTLHFKVPGHEKILRSRIRTGLQIQFCPTG